MRLLKSCGDGRTVDDGNQEELQHGLAAHLYKIEFGMGGKHVLSRAQETTTPAVEVEQTGSLSSG